jgi:hypothetical protein
LISFFSLLAYYTCKDDVITRIHCPERQLFDEDTRICHDYRKVFCGNRPTNERENDPCKNEFLFSFSNLIFFIQVSVNKMVGMRIVKINVDYIIYVPNNVRLKWVNVQLVGNGILKNFDVMIQKILLFLVKFFRLFLIP